MIRTYKKANENKSLNFFALTIYKFVISIKLNTKSES